MASPKCQYLPNRRVHRAHDYHIDLEQFLEDAPIAFSPEDDCYVDESRSKAADSEQLLEGSESGNSQFFSHKPTISKSVQLSNLDGNASPEDDEFALPEGFRRPNVGFNRPTTAARAPKAPASNHVSTQEWTDRPKPYHLLTPRELKALECLKGPPPGMPEHMMRPEDRKYCILNGRNKGPAPVNTRPRTPQQQLMGPAPTPAAPKRKTKDRTHQLAQPSGVSKPRFDLSSSRAATRKPFNGTGSKDASHRRSSGNQNGFFANGKPRLSPLSLSRDAYRALGTYALRHNGRVPFKEGFGLPSHGKLVYFGPGRLGVKLDRHCSPRTGSRDAPGRTGGSEARQGNDMSVAQWLQGAASVTEAKPRYPQMGTMKALNSYTGFDNTANFGSQRSSIGSYTLDDLELFDSYDLVQAQFEIDAAMDNLDYFAQISQGRPMAMDGMNGHAAPQQPSQPSKSFDTARNMSQGLMLQQPVQVQGNYTVQEQQHDHQPELSFPGFGNTPSTLEQMAPDARRPRSRGMGNTVQQGFGNTTAQHPAPALPASIFPAPELARSDRVRRSMSDSRSPQMQRPLPAAQTTTIHAQHSPMHEPTPPRSQSSSHHTTPRPSREPSLPASSNSQSGTLHMEDGMEDEMTFEGELVFEFPGGPMAGRLIDGHYYPFNGEPRAVFPTPPPEREQQQQQQEDQRGTVLDGRDAALPDVPMSVAAAAGEATPAAHSTAQGQAGIEAEGTSTSTSSTSTNIDAPSATTATAAAAAAEDAYVDAEISFDELTAQFLHDYEGYGGEDEGESGLF